jgi:hypothetical protein
MTCVAGFDLAVGGMQDSVLAENYAWNVVFLEFRRQLQLWLT